MNSSLLPFNCRLYFFLSLFFSVFFHFSCIFPPSSLNSGYVLLLLSIFMCYTHGTCLVSGIVLFVVIYILFQFTIILLVKLALFGLCWVLGFKCCIHLLRFHLPFLCLSESSKFDLFLNCFLLLLSFPQYVLGKLSFIE